MASIARASVGGRGGLLLPGRGMYTGKHAANANRQGTQAPGGGRSARRTLAQRAAVSEACAAFYERKRMRPPSRPARPDWWQQKSKEKQTHGQEVLQIMS